MLIVFTSVDISAQTRTATSTAPAQPIAVRQVSGVVKDSTNQTIIGASVTLTSSADTIRGVTNEDGIFVFRNVKSWVFSIEVRSLGYVSKVVAGKYNDATARLTLDPIVLKTEQRMLDAVVVNGTPSIVYKTDTIEYRASDYVVRAGATIDELLTKMEGMEVGNDGSLTVNGAAIVKARLNGKDIYGGDVATTIQNLPAEIVDKIQVVDDYGNTAARTGIKEGDPTKVLNITTRTDKSVGNMARLNAGLGTLDQQEASANLTRINKNQTLTFNGNFTNTPNGIAGGASSVGRLGGASNRGGRSGGGNGGSSAASGGTNLTTSPRFTYRDRFGKKIEFLANYSFNYNDNNAITKSYSENISIVDNLGTIDTTYSNRNAINNSISRGHNLNFEVEYNIDSANFLQFRPSFSFNSSERDNISTNSQTGFIFQDQNNFGNNSGRSPNIGATLAYQHIWLSNKARSFSLETTVGRQKNDNLSQQNNTTIDYQTTSQPVILDREIVTDNLQNNLRASATYSEPLTTISRLEFNSNLERRSYDNSRITSNLDTISNKYVVDPNLSNIFDYAFTQYRNSINYRYGNNNSRYNASVGLTAVSTNLEGTRVNVSTKTDQTYFKLIPIARFQVSFSKTHKVSINYNGRANEPSFDQIQPVRDVSNPRNPIVGNPNLKVAFIHSLNGQYSNYIANSKLNYDLRLSTSLTENQVSSNSVIIKDADSSKITETRYININGNRSNSADYSISKQFYGRKVSIVFSGNIDNVTRAYMNQGIRATSQSWGFKESLGPRINPTTWLEVNPYVSYDFSKTTYSIAKSVQQKNVALGLDGNVYFLKNLQFGYALSKNFISGISKNVSNNPFVINAMLQMKVFKNKGSLQLRAYDLLNENNFVNRTISGSYGGFTETYTNPNSRYVMMNLSMNLQKWTGAVGKGGHNLIRRGDGSFLN